MPEQPIEMQKRPLKSYLGTSYSPRTNIDSNTAKTMPTVAFTAIKVRSRKGNTSTWLTVPYTRNAMPRAKRHEQ